MTPKQRLEEIAGRESKATPGPWHVGDDDNHLWDNNSSYHGEPMMRCNREHPNDSEQRYGLVEFIAHCRSDVPWLLEQNKKIAEALRSAAIDFDRIADGVIAPKIAAAMSAHEARRVLTEDGYGEE